MFLKTHNKKAVTQIKITASSIYRDSCVRRNGINYSTSQALPAL